MLDRDPAPLLSVLAFWRRRPADIADLVKRDIGERKRLGIRRYGRPLRAWNGRDALRDAYEEALDLAMYLKQAMEERRR